ncbi:MAG: hypothetical protein CVU84_15095 [Firmicutes bacterium HGW-Firmicutes-1]|jgi:hypothetical protein|nr:MAG: hypothetical protein CVU84_15095 [Firmicutes bacterium HGW-Firmicutes-1]
MKKFGLMFVCLFVLTLSGCKSDVTLEEGQYYKVIKKDGSASIDWCLSDDEAEEIFGFDFKKDDKDEMKEAILDKIDEWDYDVEFTNFKKGDDYIKYTLIDEEGDDILFEDVDFTLEDYADDYYNLDVDELAEDMKFVYYKNDEKVDEEDIEDYEDSFAISIYGDIEGAYYKVPGKILLVGEESEDMDYEKISKDTIFLDKDVSVVIVYK